MPQPTEEINKGNDRNKPTTTTTTYLPVWITQSISQISQFDSPFSYQDQQPEQQPEQQQLQETEVSDGELSSSDSLAIRTDSDELNGMVSHAKQLANQLQELVHERSDFDLLVQGRQPTVEELVHRLSDVLGHQREVNEATSRMTATNYVVNMINFVRNRQLKGLVQDGRRKLRLMGSNVVQLEKKVVDLNTEVLVQKKTSERFKSGLEATKNLLETSISEYRAELSRQNDLLRRQQKTVSDLFKSRFNQDLILDSSIFGISLYAVNSILVDYPIQLILWLVQNGVYRSRSSKSQKRTEFIRQLLKMIVLVCAFKELRGLAVFYGLHNQVGGISKYLFYTVQNVFLAGKAILGVKAKQQDNKEETTGELEKGLISSGSSS
jgi:hypothetical protein